MKRVNVLQIVLELIGILGNIIVGTTILTFLYRHVGIDRIFIGLIIIAMGIFGIIEFFTLKFVARNKSIPRLIGCIAFVALGTVFLIVKMDIKLLCIIWGSVSIAVSIAKIVTSALNLLRQPLLNGIRIILNVVTIVFAIILIVRGVNFLTGYLTLLCVTFYMEAATLFIEFIIHRYQN